MCDLMGDIAKEGIEKGRKNAQQGYAFRGIEDVYNTLCGLLAKHRLTLVPHKLLSLERDARETKSGGTLYVTYITVQWKITSAVDGSCEYAESLGEGMDSADKSGNKSMSAAYKYAAVQVFCIPTEGTDDGDATTPEPSRPRTPPQQQQRTPAQQQRTTAPAGAGAKLHEKYSLVWFLYSNSSVVGQHVSKIPAEKLASYIERLEATMKGKDAANAAEAQWYYQAALREHDARMAREGANEAPKSASTASA
jgi:hypothetical protein